MYTYKLAGNDLKFKTQPGVFYPTDTSELLIAGSRKRLKQPGAFLDLGCGIGVIGITLAKLGLIKPPIYASDLSPEAVCLAEQNAQDHGYEITAKVGALFQPWTGSRFDAIVDDVPGITQEIAAVSRWFPTGVPCDSGPDGTALIEKVLEEAPEHLAPGGVLIFPVLSLSNTRKLLAKANKHFSSVERLIRRMWSLPDELKPHLDFLKRLHREEKICIEEKFGMTLWYTEVYAASNGR